MQQIPPFEKVGPGKKKPFIDWAWEVDPKDSKKTIAFIKKNVKKQIDAALAKGKKKRTAEYSWHFRVKVYLTPPAKMPRPGAAGTSDPPSPTQPPPPKIT